jgi:hypothetical protein
MAAQLVASRVVFGSTELVSYLILFPVKQLYMGKICGFHGGGYEECRRLGYKNPVCTSKETRHVSATGHSRLILCTN